MAAGPLPVGVGPVPRGRLVEACAALGRGDEPAVWDLLEPFEEGMTVQRG